MKTPITLHPVVEKTLCLTLFVLSGIPAYLMCMFARFNFSGMQPRWFDNPFEWAPLILWYGCTILYIRYVSIQNLNTKTEETE